MPSPRSRAIRPRPSDREEPLMLLTDFIIFVLAGAIVTAATAHNAVEYILAFVAVAFAAMNVVGGYVVTGRMLKLFKRRIAPAPASPAVEASPNGKAAT